MELIDEIRLTVLCRRPRESSGTQICSELYAEHQTLIDSKQHWRVQMVISRKEIPMT